MKKLNTSVVENELTQGSVFFRKSQPDQATDEGSLSLPCSIADKEKGANKRKLSSENSTEKTRRRSENRTNGKPNGKAFGSTPSQTSYETL